MMSRAGLTVPVFPARNDRAGAGTCVDDPPGSAPIGIQFVAPLDEASRKQLSSYLF
jgi:hypothetical protein